MIRQEKICKTLMAFTLSAGILFSGNISVYAEENATPQPTDSPAASSEATASEAPETASPAPAETVTPTETPAPAPEATATPAPSVQPTPEATAVPTSTPAPTPAPAETPTPTAAPTATPEPSSADPNDTSSEGAAEVSIYRLYNPVSGEHFYTSVNNESEHLKSLGWRYEGIGWVSPSKGNPVYRLYNSYNGGTSLYSECS